MAYRNAILLDLDGTLVDTAADFVAVINQMRGIDNLPPLPAQTIRNTVSDGARALVTLAYQIDENHSEFEKKRQWLLEMYEKELGKNATIFSGFNTLLEKLEANDIAWGIITNKPSRFTIPLLESLNIRPTRNVAICPDHVSQTKPHPEPLLLAAKKLSLQPAQCIYAGDHARDIEAGRRAGMKTIACAYGYIKSDDDINSWRADTTVQSVQELEQILCQQFNLE